MGASNAEVIDSLALQINVKINGQKKLSTFNKDVKALSSSLADCNQHLTTFVESLGNLNIPNIGKSLRGGKSSSSSKNESTQIKDLTNLSAVTKVASKSIESLSTKINLVTTNWDERFQNSLKSLVTDESGVTRNERQSYQQFVENIPEAAWKLPSELADSANRSVETFFNNVKLVTDGWNDKFSTSVAQLTANSKGMGKSERNSYQQFLENLPNSNWNLPNVKLVTDGWDKRFSASVAQLTANSKGMGGSDRESYQKFLENLPDTAWVTPNKSLLEFAEVMEKIVPVSFDAKNAVRAFTASVQKLGSSLKSSVIKGLDNFKKKLSGLISSFTRILKYRAIRSIIKAITSGVTEGVQNLARYSSAFNETMSKLSTSSLYFKNAIATLISPLLEEFIPVLQEVINWIVEVINKINELVAVARGASVWYKAKEYQVDYAKSLDSTSKSADKLKRSLMRFDEINRLSDDSSSSSGQDYSKMFTTEATPVDGDAVKEVETTLRTIERIAGAFMLAIGVLLVCTGHLALGIAAIIAGITLTKASLNWKTMEDGIGKTLSKIEAIVGAAVLALGAILAFSGANLPLGIGLMVIGATLIAGSILLDWSALSNKVDTVCTCIGIMVSAASLAIGMILAASCPQFMALGIALIAVGAVGLASSVALNWDDMSDKVKSTVTGIMTFISGMLLIVGLLLACSGVNIPLGIALMAAGGIGLATVTALNWDKLKTDFMNSFNDMKDKASKGLTELKDLFEKWKAKLKLPSISWDYNSGWKATGLVKKALDAFNLPDTIPKPKVTWPTYATGGFPEDGLFMANHGELVGKFSNGKTAVANNQQITDGIEEAAYRGFSRAMSMSNGGNNNGTTTFIAQLNGKTLFEEVVRQNNSSVKTYGLSPLNSF